MWSQMTIGFWSRNYSLYSSMHRRLQKVYNLELCTVTLFCVYLSGNGGWRWFLKIHCLSIDSCYQSCPLILRTTRMTFGSSMPSQASTLLSNFILVNTGMTRLLWPMTSSILTPRNTIAPVIDMAWFLFWYHNWWHLWSFAAHAYISCTHNTQYERQ